MADEKKKSMLEKLKEQKAALEASSKTQGDAEEGTGYNIESLADDKTWLDKLPKEGLTTGVVSEDGELNASELEKTIQRAMFNSMKSVGAEMQRTFAAEREAMQSMLEERLGASFQDQAEKSLTFYEEEPIKNKLALSEYARIKAEFPNATMSDWRKATLEVMSEYEAVEVAKVEAEQDKADKSANPYKHLLDGVDLEEPDESSKED